MIPMKLLNHIRIALNRINNLEDWTGVPRRLVTLVLVVLWPIAIASILLVIAILFAVLKAFGLPDSVIVGIGVTLLLLLLLLGAVGFILDWVNEQRQKQEQRLTKTVLATVRNAWRPVSGTGVNVLFESEYGELTAPFADDSGEIYFALVDKVGHLAFVDRRGRQTFKHFAIPEVEGESEKRVFISYSRQYSQSAKYIGQVLKRCRFNVFLDEDDVRFIGDKLTSQFNEAIGNSDFFVAVISVEYFASPWCVEELEHATSRRKQILIVRVGGYDEFYAPPKFRKLVDEQMFLDLRGGPNVKDLQRMVAEMVSRTNSGVVARHSHSVSSDATIVDGENCSEDWPALFNGVEERIRSLEVQVSKIEEALRSRV